MLDENQPPTPKELLAAFAQAIHDRDLLQLIEQDGIEISPAKIKGILEKKVHGSPLQTLIINTLVAATGFVPIGGISPVASSVPGLSGSERNLLVGIPSVSGAFLMLVLGSQLENSSGRNYLTLFRMISLAGMLGLSWHISTTELEKLNYAALLFFNALTGFSIPSFLLNTNLIWWTPLEKSGAQLAKFAAISGLAPGLTLLVLTLSKSYINLSFAFIIAAVILLIGTIVLFFGVRESPYTQLLNLGLSEPHAKELAKYIGQDKFPIRLTTAYPAALWNTARSFSALALSAATISSFAVFLLMTTSLYISLTRTLAFEPNTAVYTTAGFSTGAMTVRYFSGKLMERFDKSTGYLTFLLGMFCIFLGSLMQAINRPTPTLPYVMIAQSIIAAGIGVSSGASFKLLVQWSKKIAYPVAIMSAFASFSGQLNGFILNAIVAAIVSNGDDERYFDTFSMMASIAVLGAVLVALGEKNAQKPIAQTI